MLAIKSILSFIISFSLVLGPTLSAAAAAGDSNPAPQALKTEEIDQLVAPVALYPDALLAQVLMASTYPMEVVLAARWAKANSKLKGQDLEKALGNQNWDPSVKSLVSFPQALQMMNDQIEWTEKLGNAFLAQQSDVMDSVQRLRAKAYAQGALKSGKEQKVTQSSSGSQTIYVIEPANPQVVYVPTYNPTVVYGTWPYPSYPPMSWSPAGYVATSLVSFGLGMAVGAAIWGGCNWGYGPSHGTYINVNNFNNFNRFNHFTPPPGPHPGPHGNLVWQHDNAHRMGIPYADRGSQQRFNPGSASNNAAREAFRGRINDIDHGRDGFNRPQNALGRDGAGQRREINRPNSELGHGGAGERHEFNRPQNALGRDGAGQRREINRPNSELGRGGAGEQHNFNQQRNDLGRGGSGQRHEISGQNRQSAFSGVQNGNRSRIESSRGAQSRQFAGHTSGGGGGRVSSGGGGHFGGGGGGHGGFRR